MALIRVVVHRLAAQILIVFPDPDEEVLLDFRPFLRRVQIISPVVRPGSLRHDAAGRFIVVENGGGTLRVPAEEILDPPFGLLPVNRVAGQQIEQGETLHPPHVRPGGGIDLRVHFAPFRVLPRRQERGFGNEFPADVRSHRFFQVLRERFEIAVRRTFPECGQPVRGDGEPGVGLRQVRRQLLPGRERQFRQARDHFKTPGFAPYGLSGPLHAVTPVPDAGLQHGFRNFGVDCQPGAADRIGGLECGVPGILQ